MENHTHNWQIIESGRLSAKAIMAKDAQLLRHLRSFPAPILHFYEWEQPSLTYGYFIDLASHLHLSRLDLHGLHDARRPTGGGILFHLTDWAFSLLIPSHYPQFSLQTLKNYAWVNQHVLQALASWTDLSLALQTLPSTPQPSPPNCEAFCMARPMSYDLMLGDKKIGGAAQRRTQQGFLHQATLSLIPPPWDLLQEVLIHPTETVEAMRTKGGYLLPPYSTAQDHTQACKSLKQALSTYFKSDEKYIWKYPRCPNESYTWG